MRKWMTMASVALAVCVVPAGPGPAWTERRPAKKVNAEIGEVASPGLVGTIRGGEKAVDEVGAASDEGDGGPK